MALTDKQIAVRAKWVAALRSGKYKQGSGALHCQDGAMCCLGVLYDVQGGKWFPRYGSNGPRGSKTLNGSTYNLNNEGWALAGLSFDDLDDLISRNDNDGDDFNTIADIIDLLTLADTSEAVTHAAS